jgi:tRNA(Ile2) C34 agmatinyltransferase TiaS
MRRLKTGESHCPKCGRRVPSKKLHDLGEAGVRCQTCFDHIPSAERRSLLRRAKASR